MSPKNAKRAVIYTRISRDDSGEGAANQRQEEDCRKLADLRGWEVVAVEADISISASTGKTRPAWNRVLSMIEAGEVDVVLAWHMDRMTRSMVDLEKLIVIAEKQGVGVATVTGDIDLTTDVGRMVARILAAVARAEVERKGARQRRANEQRARQGVAWTAGFRPFGYDVVGKGKKARLSINEVEAALLRQATEDILNGTPLRGIVRQWKEMQVPTARSRKNVDGWTPNSVRAILLNPRNAAIATYKGEVVGKGDWEPIISEETHILLVATLTDPARTRGEGKHQGNKPRNLLSGIATCAECGWKVEAGSTAGHKVYKCSNPDGDHLSTRRNEADQIVRSSLAMSIGATAPGTLTKKKDKGVPQDLWAERERIKERLAKLATSWATDTLTDDQFEAASASLKDQLHDVELSIEEGALETDDLDRRWEDARNFLSLDLWGQRRVLEDLADIKLWGRNRKRSLPITAQVTMYVTDLQGRTWAALDERKSQPLDPSAAIYEAMASLLVEQQPEGVTTLQKASEWLVESAYPERKASGLSGKLSPLVRYVRGETRGASGWTRKSAR